MCVCVCVCVCVYMHVCMLSHISHVQLCVALWTVAHQTPLSMGFSRQEYWIWVATSFSRGSSQPRDQTRIDCLLHWQASSLPPVLPEKHYIYRVSNQEKNTSRLYCHPAYLTSMQSTSCEMLGWMKRKLESRLPG